jgi:hypothetical protein
MSKILDLFWPTVEGGTAEQVPPDEIEAIRRVWRCQLWAGCTTNISERKFPTRTGVSGLLALEILGSGGKPGSSVTYVISSGVCANRTSSQYREMTEFDPLQSGQPARECASYKRNRCAPIKSINAFHISHDLHLLRHYYIFPTKSRLLLSS